MRHMLVLLLVLVAGCNAGNQVLQSVEPPELISLVPLPPYRAITLQQSIKLELMILVGKDGSVDDVELLNSTGSSDWDTLALKSIRGWRFTSPRRNGTPTEIWIRQAVTVEFQNPIMMVLAQLTLDDRQTADSIFLLLNEGVDFRTLATQLKSATPALSGGLIGTVDITQYPGPVREALSKLRVGEITHPVKVGDRFLIYKRLAKEAS